MNKPGTTQLATIETSQLTTITGGVINPIYRLPTPSNPNGGCVPPSYPPAPRPSPNPWAPGWSYPYPSRLPIYHNLPGVPYGCPDLGRPTHHYYGV